MPKNCKRIFPDFNIHYRTKDGAYHSEGPFKTPGMAEKTMIRIMNNPETWAISVHLVEEPVEGAPTTNHLAVMLRKEGKFDEVARPVEMPTYIRNEWAERGRRKHHFCKHPRHYTR